MGKLFFLNIPDQDSFNNVPIPQRPWFKCLYRSLFFSLRSVNLIAFCTKQKRCRTNLLENLPPYRSPIIPVTFLEVSHSSHDGRISICFPSLWLFQNNFFWIVFRIHICGVDYTEASLVASELAV